MDEHPSPVRRRGGTHSSKESSRGGSSNRKVAALKSRQPPVDDDTGDPIECTGRSCKSCTGGLIADCVAVCCCPCAVVDILALAFFKVPWVMGRKCIKGLGRKKKKLLEKKMRTKCERSRGPGAEGDADVNSRTARVEEGTLEIVTSRGLGEDEEEQKDNFSARFDAEEVWFELYQIGHLGFGRVSFTGAPSQARSN